MNLVIPRTSKNNRDENKFYTSLNAPRYIGIFKVTLMIPILEMYM